jgi:hypothetical protein
MQRLARDDIPAVVEGDGVDFRTQAVGEMSIAWVPTEELKPVLDHITGGG